MVSLESRNQFIADCRDEPSMHFALALVFDESCNAPNANSISDRAASAIAINAEDTFLDVVKELRRRKIKPDADWVLDDFLLFALLVGSKKFNVGDELCRAIINERRPTNALDVAYHGALRSLSQNAYAIEGEFSFVKLVFCELVGQLHIDSSIARTVYDEVSNPKLLENLDTFPKVLAYRAFDLLILHKIEHEFDSTDAIVSAIESQSKEMSVRKWIKVALSMRLSVWIWIGAVILSLCTGSFYAGRWSATITASDSSESLIESNNRMSPLARPDESGHD